MVCLSKWKSHFEFSGICCYSIWSKIFRIWIDIILLLIHLILLPIIIPLNLFPHYAWLYTLFLDVDGIFRPQCKIDVHLLHTAIAFVKLKSIFVFMEFSVFVIFQQCLNLAVAICTRKKKEENKHLFQNWAIYLRNPGYF